MAKSINWHVFILLSISIKSGQHISLVSSDYIEKYNVNLLWTLSIIVFYWCSYHFSFTFMSVNFHQHHHHPPHRHHHYHHSFFLRYCFKTILKNTIIVATTLSHTYSQNYLPLLSDILSGQSKLFISLTKSTVSSPSCYPTLYLWLHHTVATKYQRTILIKATCQEALSEPQNKTSDQSRRAFRQVRQPLQCWCNYETANYTQGNDKTLWVIQTVRNGWQFSLRLQFHDLECIRWCS